MHFYDPSVDVYYRPEMTAADASGNVSKSPTKPRRFVEWLGTSSLATAVRIRSDWAPLEAKDFLLAHTGAYVDGFFAGVEPHASANGLAWSAGFASSVRYTNGSLLAAIRAATDQPRRIALSPTSGFHHATPAGGGGFCTFSGQVVAALRLFRERGLRGAWIDLDAHYGNSIPDSLRFAQDLGRAIPFNVNPPGTHREYLSELRHGLDAVGAAVCRGEIDYLAVAHGADSHMDDDLGGQCTTAEWLEASHLVYGAISAWSADLGRPVPLALALFGGYRRAAYDGVLRLHAADLAIALDELAGTRFAFDPNV